MNSLKFRKFIINFSFILILSLCKDFYVEASSINDVKTNLNNSIQFNNFDEKKLLSLLNSCKESLKNITSSKTKTSPEQLNIKIIDILSKSLENFKTYIEKNKLDYTKFNKKFVDELNETLRSIGGLVTEIRNDDNNKSESKLNKLIDKYFQDVENFNVMFFKNYKSKEASNIQIKNNIYENSILDGYSNFVDWVNYCYDFVLNFEDKKIDKQLYREFFGKIKSINKFIKNFVIKSEHYNPLSFFDFIDSLLDCNLKIYKILDKIYPDKNFNFGHNFNLKLGENAKKLLNDFYENYLNFQNVIDRLNFGIGDYKFKNKHFLFSLKTVYSKLCAESIDCENANVNNINDILLQIREILDRMKNYYEYIPASNSFGTINWVTVKILDLLEKINSEISGDKYKNYDLQSVVNNSINEFIKNFKDKENKNEKSVSNCKDEIKTVMNKFKLECDSIYNNLCSINNQIHNDYCYPCTSPINSIYSYLKKLNSEIGPLKQKISQIIFFDDFFKFHSVLDSLNSNLERITSDKEIEDENGVLNKISNLIDICSIFVNPKNFTNDFTKVNVNILRMIKDLDLKIRKIGNLNKTNDSLNLEILQDIDLIISILEFIQFFYNEGYDLFLECCYNLINPKSNIIKFLNDILKKLNNADFINFFSKNFYCYDQSKSFYSPFLVNLDKTYNEINDVVHYANYNLLRLGVLKLKFLDVSNFYSSKFKKISDKYRANEGIDENSQLAISVDLNNEFKILENYLILLKYINTMGNKNFDDMKILSNNINIKKENILDFLNKRRESCDKTFKNYISHMINIFSYDMENFLKI